jgi:methylated-DNA-protein-cysteine methyltransferase-like protein
MEDGFFARVYAAVCRIPKGKVATYGQIAAMAGNHRMARQVGWALHVNPRPGEIPCHRVVNRLGECSGSFAFGGIDAQRRLIEGEGVKFTAEGKVESEFFWNGEVTDYVEM